MFEAMRTNNGLFIRRQRYIRIAGTISAFILSIIALLAVFPIVSKIEQTEATTNTAEQSETIITMTSNYASADLDLTPHDANGTFASSSEANLAKFGVTTNNYTGYTLSISASNDDKQLVNSSASSALDSITAATDSTTFNSSTSYNGKWGYKPSKYNSVANASFLPSPTTSATTLDATSAANNESNDYTIGLGARVDYSKPAGAYTNTFVLTTVGNPIAYTINYLDNTNDNSVANLPNTDSGTSSVTTVILSDATPTRTGYTFSKWCLGTVSNDGTTCTGTQYAKGASINFIDQTVATNTINLYALWTPNEYTITLNGNGATNTYTTSTKATYKSTTLAAIATLPARSYTVSGFTKTSSATDATVSSTDSLTSTYSFTGWYKEAAATNKIASNAATPALEASTSYTNSSKQWTSTSAQTLYAGWDNTVSGAKITLPTITKEGYTCGWATSSTATTYTYTSGQTNVVPTSNLTLYGVCTIKSNLSLKVTFAGTGVSNVKVCKVSGNCSDDNLLGTISTSGNSVSGLTYGTAYYLYPSYSTGYALSKWAKDSGAVGTLSSTSAANPTYTIGDGTNAVTITGKAKTYTITLNGNGATNTPTASVKATYKSTTLAAIATLPARSYTVSGFTKTSSATDATVSSTDSLTSTYSFTGWYKEAAATNKIASNAATPALEASTSYTNSSKQWTSTSAQTLYAGWDNTVAAAKVTLPTIALAGHTCGWATSDNATTWTYTSGQTNVVPAENTTLYGVCVPNKYNITIKTATGISKVTINKKATTDTGSDDILECTSTSGCTANNLTYGKTYAITATTSTGYTFKSWSAGSNGSVASTSTASTTYTVGAGTSTITPSATANKYTITLNGNGATNTYTTSTKATYKSTTLAAIATLPARSYTISGFTKTSSATGATVSSTDSLTSTYSFTGWYKEAAATNKIANNVATPALEASTSYTNSSKQWTSTSAQTLYAGWDNTVAAAKVTLPTISRTGYTCGWAKTSTATTWDYSSGQTNIIPEENMTLYGVCIVKSDLSLKINFAGTGVSSVKVCKTSGDCSGSNLMGTVSSSGGSVPNLTYDVSYYLYPAFNPGYGFDSWVKTGGVGTLGSTSTANTTYTIGNGNGEVTVTGKITALPMQSFNYSSCTTTPQAVYDTRDNQIYTIQKLADNNCWMLDNLSLGSTTLAQSLSTSNTNMSSSTAFTLPEASQTGSSFSSYTAPKIYTAKADVVTSSYGNTTPRGSGSGKSGVFYNFCAASAGTICADSNGSNAIYDICPKGWRLPTGGNGGEYENLYLAYSSNNINFRTALSTPLSGLLYDGRFAFEDKSGNFWSSTNHNGDIYGMYHLTTRTNTDSDPVSAVISSRRERGMSVRCVIDNSYSLAINFAGSGVSSVQIRTAAGTGGTLVGTISSSGNSVSGLSYNTTYYLYPVFSSGYKLDNWANSGSIGTLSSTSATNPTFTMSRGGMGSITITGKQNTMQDFTFTEANGMREGETRTLKDVRDGQEYSVSKIGGEVWMTQNLRFTGTSLDPSTSNVSAAKTISYGNLSSGNSTDQARIASSSDTNIGVYYNFAAASAMSITGSSNTTIATQSVCPKGWRLPTLGEIQKLVGSIGTTASRFSPVRGGYYIGGSLGNQTSYGLWWTATPYDASTRHLLVYNSAGSLLIDTSPADDYRYDGFNIRCIANLTPYQKLTAGILSMQEIGMLSTSERSALASQISTSSYNVKDSREMSKTYKIHKASDGNLWMANTLSIGCNGSTRINTPMTPLDTSISNSYNTSYADSSFSSASAPSMACDGREGFYNFMMLSAGHSTSEWKKTLEESICPKGWSIPTIAKLKPVKDEINWGGGYYNKNGYQDPSTDTKWYYYLWSANYNSETGGRCGYRLTETETSSGDLNYSYSSVSIGGTTGYPAICTISTSE